MKLNDIKDNIDNYFKHIKSKDLYNILTKKYGFKEKKSNFSCLFQYLFIPLQC